jgi:hypothetical protein
MKAFVKVVALLLMCSGALAAQQDLAGTWQGKLQVDPKTSLTIQFTFTRQPDGTYSAVLNSPDNGGIKDVTATAVSWSDGTLKLAVASLSGSYAGTLRGGKIEGQWTQPGGDLPLVLSPYEKPQLSAAAMKTLTGAWNGPLQVPGGKFTFVTRFKVDGKGVLQGTLAVPEQGGQEVPLSDIEFADNKLSFKVAPVRGEYQATFANDTFTGAWKQSGQPPAGLPVVLKRGDVGTPVYPLKISNQSFVQLSGNWEGTLQPKGPDGKPVSGPDGKPVSLALILRFEVNADAQYIGFIDSPAQNIKGIPVTEASLTGSKLDLKAASLFAEYQADLSGRTLTGQWTQGPRSLPLTLKKK